MSGKNSLCLFNDMQKTMEENIRKANEIATAVSACGGRVFYVGGYVRDLLRGIDNKDIDLEVHGIEVSQLKEILNQCGEEISMGESFGIFQLKHYNLDIAMPRNEKATGRGHKDFAISVDPYIGTYKAALRRDFTVNALMQDVLTKEVLDYFGGQEDLKKGILRHVNERTFSEDPLRVLRCAQFAARFRYAIAEDTVALCKTMDLTTLSKERILSETEKALLYSDQPSVFFDALKEMEQLDGWFAEVKALIDVPQNPVYHAEGDAYTHTMMVLDEAAKYRSSVSNPLYFMMAALVHDFGKAITTKEENGRIRSIGHEREGLPLVQRFIKRLTNEKGLLHYCMNMTELHMLPGQKLKCNASQKSFNNLFDQSVQPMDLIYLSVADNNGRIAKEKTDDFEALLKKYETFCTMMAKPYVSGETLIQMRYVPDEHFKEVLEYAHKLRLAGVDYDAQVKQTRAYANKVLKKKEGENDETGRNAV